MSPRRFFEFLAVAAIFGISSNPATDPDLFWHLKTGDYILANGVPRQDPGFSFTAEGWDWVAHEWLTQVFMATIYNHLGGTTALVVVFAGVVALAFWLLMYASDGRPYLAGAVAIMACLASSPLIQARPQMFNILFSAWIVCVAERIRRGQWPTLWIWTFVPLTMLWVNMHGGFVLGFAVIGVYIVGGYLALRLPGGREPGLDLGQLKTFVAAALAGVVVSGFNPNTYRMWSYTYDTLTSRAMRDIITEWQSPDFHEPKFWPFALLITGVFLAMALSRLRPTPTELLFVIGTCLAGLQSIRNIPIFAVVVVPILSRHLLAAFANRPSYAVLSGESAQPAPNSMMKAVAWLLIGAVSLLVVAAAATQGRATALAVAERFPVAATDWIEAEGLKEKRLFNEYGWGGYLIWRDIPVFVDGRADVYGDEFLYDFAATNDAAGDWRAALDEHGVELILVRVEATLRPVLEEAHDWTAVYRDDLAVVFEANTPVAN